MNREVIASLDEIGEVVTAIEEIAPPNAILFLTGDLASGKTTLTRAIAKSKGIQSAVTSPTFSLQQIYDERLFHYDLYRISNEEFFALGLYEELERNGWHIIEWADSNLKSFLANVGYNTLSILITRVGESRNYTIEA